jgi:hypothetical protein
MSLFHIHKFGPIQGDNFQYCATCGVAKAAPNPCKEGHKYKEDSVSEITNHFNRTQIVKNLVCIRCGHMVQFNATTGQYQN